MVIRLFTKVIMSIKVFVLLALLFAMPDSVLGQWECRSKLPAHLKAISSKFPLYWSAELAIGLGRLNDRNIVNTLFFVGLNYTTGKHRLYSEGGCKMWRSNENGEVYKKKRLGPRELFYGYQTEKTMVIIGFQSLVLGDYFLVNERGSGISMTQSFGNLTLDTRLASVDKDFSRYGTFCSVRYLYDIIPGRQIVLPGDGFGDTNLGGLVLTWRPSRKSSEKAVIEPEQTEDSRLDEFEEFESSNEFDEFQSTDEFEEFAEFDSSNNISNIVSKDKESILKEAGLILYSEFYFGIMAELEPFWKIRFQPEILYQYIDNENALIYHLQAINEYIWRSGSRSIFNLIYYGKYAIDDDAQAKLSFGNLFAGETARLDAIDMPFVQAAFKHNFPSVRLHFKIQYVYQLEANHINEIDLAVGKTFGKFLKITCMFGRIQADPLDETYYLGRAEIRVTF